MAEPSRLRAESVTLAYEEVEVCRELSVDVPDGQVTVIVGANACGKSTLLRALARLLAPRDGVVVLDGQDISRLPTREVALRLGILPQSPVAPSGITVADLVARGRFAHRRWHHQWTRTNEEATARALVATRTLDLAARRVDELSGGQRQRVWIAMLLAQDTPLMLLDEPTTYLDLAHQVEVLDLLTDLNREQGRTVVMVLHDLNHAARVADHVVALRHGRIVAQGTAAEVVTRETVSEVFGLDCRVYPDPLTGTPLVLPLGRHVAIPPDPPADPPADLWSSS